MDDENSVIDFPIYQFDNYEIFPVNAPIFQPTQLEIVDSFDKSYMENENEYISPCFPDMMTTPKHERKRIRTDGTSGPANRKARSAFNFLSLQMPNAFSFVDEEKENRIQQPAQLEITESYDGSYMENHNEDANFQFPRNNSQVSTTPRNTPRSKTRVWRDWLWQEGPLQFSSNEEKLADTVKHSKNEKEFKGNGKKKRPTKKRYRLSYCWFCQLFSPDAEWAEKKIRRIENERIDIHENSRGHQYAKSELDKFLESNDTVLDNDALPTSYSELDSLYE